MLPHSLVIVLLFTLFCAQIVLSCTYVAEDFRAHCASFDNLKLIGDRPEWIRLNIENYGNESFSIIKRDCFNNTPNVLDLYIKKIASGIEDGAFNGLHKLHELNLKDNKLHVIKSSVFLNIPIERISIYNCEVKEIEHKAFQNMPNLKYVRIYGDHIDTIEAGVFSYSNIHLLIMRKNEIKSVQPNAFEEMEQLHHLSLEENQLTSFEPQLTLGFRPSLTYLYINRNQIRKVTRDMFVCVPNLIVLLLNINNITRFGDHAFNDLKNLALLDISNNKLEEFQKESLPLNGLKKLEKIFLHDNQLSFLSTGVLARLPAVRSISVGGNPWQCPCWNILDDFLVHNNITRLCYEVYTQGERPSCVFSEKYPKDCILDLESMRDIPPIFFKTIAEYPHLPRVCNVDGLEMPVLGP